MSQFHAIIEWKKSIAGHYSIMQVKIELLCFFKGLSQSVDTTGLPTTLAKQLFIFYESDRVTFQMFANEVGKDQVFLFFFGRFPSAFLFPLTKIPFVDRLDEFTVQQGSVHFRDHVFGNGVFRFWCNL